MRITNYGSHPRSGACAAMVVLLLSALASAQNATLHEATLFSRHSLPNAEYRKSFYSFYVMARGDELPQIKSNRAQLLYGYIAFNNKDSDWFAVSMGGTGSSRIKDLGAKQWSEAVTTPFISTSPYSTEAVRAPGRRESYEESSEGRVTKVVVGHLYAIHIKDDKEDLYVMLRVDELTPNDNCKISWRVVPPPGESWLVND